MSNPTRNSDKRQAVSPRLLQREKKIIIHRYIAWLRGDGCCCGYGDDVMVLDLRFGRAIIDMRLGTFLDISEVRARPETLIDRWEPRA